MIGHNGMDNSNSSESHRGLAEDSAKKQVSMLLYCLGEEAELVLNSTNVTEEDKFDYSRIIVKFNTIFRSAGMLYSKERNSITGANFLVKQGNNIYHGPV